jgi:ribonuclease VapC
MADAVLDASAILALVLEEPGAERVEPYVPGGTASAVNVGEVVAKLRDLGMMEARVDEIIAGMQLDVHGHDLTAALASRAPASRDAARRPLPCGSGLSRARRSARPARADRRS